MTHTFRPTPTISSLKSLAITKACLLFLLISFFQSHELKGQLTANEVLQKSIEYHDPQGLLQKGYWHLDLTETRPNGSDRKSKIVLSPQKEYYKIMRNVDGNQIVMIGNQGKSSFSLNGNRKVSAQQIKEHRLTNERLQMMSSYYRYLWHLPMTLLDPGTIIDTEVKQKKFDSQDALEIKVTYDPKVGDDIWYFYFDPSNYKLIAYRFYHDESANDGEYILLSGETKYKSVRLPSLRKWYMHTDDKYLGSDQLTQLQKKKK